MFALKGGANRWIIARRARKAISDHEEITGRLRAAIILMDAKSHPAVCTGHGNELISPHTRTLYPSRSCSNQRRATIDPLFLPSSSPFRPFFSHLSSSASSPRLSSPFVLCHSVQNSLSLENHLHTWAPLVATLCHEHNAYEEPGRSLIASLTFQWVINCSFVGWEYRCLLLWPESVDFEIYMCVFWCIPFASCSFLKLDFNYLGW